MSLVCLTQLRGLAEDEGVGPELADGGAVEADVTDGLLEAAGCEDVQHVQPRPGRSDDAAAQRAKTLAEKQHRVCSSTPTTAATEDTALRPVRNVLTVVSPGFSLSSPGHIPHLNPFSRRNRLKGTYISKTLNQPRGIDSSK